MNEDLSHSRNDFALSIDQMFAAMAPLACSTYPSCLEHLKEMEHSLFTTTPNLHFSRMFPHNLATSDDQNPVSMDLLDYDIDDNYQRFQLMLSSIVHCGISSEKDSIHSSLNNLLESVLRIFIRKRIVHSDVQDLTLQEAALNIAKELSPYRASSNDDTNDLSAAPWQIIDTHSRMRALEISAKVLEGMWGPLIMRIYYILYHIQVSTDDDWFFSFKQGWESVSWCYFYDLAGWAHVESAK